MSTQLLHVGHGRLTNQNWLITVDSKLKSTVRSTDKLVGRIYLNVKYLFHESYNCSCEQTIMSLKIASVDEINGEILEKLLSKHRIYKSVDTVINLEVTVHNPQKF